jgi:hypothetical protein
MGVNTCFLCGSKRPKGGKKTLAMDLEKYVSLMTDNKGVNILKTNRKTGFLGIIINLRNTFTLFEDLNKKGLEFLLTYKLCQDFLETFFGAIRSRGGFNNNPNCLQFKTAYRQLLLRHEIKELDNGNCSFDGVQILHTSSKSVDNSSEVNTDVEINPEEIDEDIILSTFYELTHYVEGVVDYIAGFVAKKLKTKFECHICIQNLEGSDEKMPLLKKIKNRGSLKTPSTDVAYICKTAEKFIRHHDIKKIICTT